MKRIALGLAGVFIVALAVAVAKQLSSEAMAVIVGIVCGIGASIPTSLVVLYLLSRQEKTQEQHEQQWAQQRQPNAAPTIMIVNPGGGMPAPSYYQQQAMPYFPALGMPAQAGGPRQFHMLGSDDDQP